MIDKKILLSRIIMLLYMVAVAVLCFAKFGNGLDLGNDFLGIAKDKIAHFMMFIPFPVLAVMSFYRSGGSPKKLILFVVVILIIGLVLAGTTELVQGALGYRSEDINDFRADALGLFTGSVAVVAYYAATKKW
ncbi:MAG: VanZ family protein [Candidatus Cryptobacteroides sp.]